MDDYNVFGRLLCRLNIHSWVYDRQGDYILKTCVRCSKQKKKPLKNQKDDTNNHGPDRNRQEK